MPSNKVMSLSFIVLLMLKCLFDVVSYKYLNLPELPDYKSLVPFALSVITSVSLLRVIFSERKIWMFLLIVLMFFILIIYKVEVVYIITLGLAYVVDSSYYTGRKRNSST